MKLSLIGKLKLKRVLRYAGLLILLALFAGAIATNFFNGSDKTFAAEYNISGSSNGGYLNSTAGGKETYLLDGWVMDNNNALGRVAPRLNLSGKSVSISDRAAIRMDNSRSGFNGNNPLFTQVSQTDPSSLTPRNSTGKTMLSSLSITGGSSITNTPLDYLTAYDRWLSAGYPFAIRYTGFYYNDNGIGDLQFGAVAAGAVKIEVYQSGSWSTVYDDYSSDHDWNNGTPSADINYIAKTYLPVRISYYNSGGAAGLTLAVRLDPTHWAVPKSGNAGAAAGRFYTGPDDGLYAEGLVADYYLYNQRLPQYSLTDMTNSYSSFGKDNVLFWDSGTAFTMSKFRFSFITKNYIAKYRSSACGIALYPSTYATLTAVKNAGGNCHGTGGPFVHSDGTFVNVSEDSGVSIELYDIGTKTRPDQVESENSEDIWWGGRSRINLELTGALTLTGGSAIDAKATGWAASPRTNTDELDPDSFMHSCIIPNQNYWVYGRGMGYGGGWLNYNCGDGNGIAGGGSYGGYGDPVERRPDYTAPYSTLPRNLYGDQKDVEWLGSGGGATNQDGVASGAGGGLIILKLSNLIIDSASRISADGQNTLNTNTAGGSGGGIHINFTDMIRLQNPIITANGGDSGNTADGGAGGGGRIWVENVLADSIYDTITANSGCTVNPFCDDAGWYGSLQRATNGSRSIDEQMREVLSIKKTLEPVSRNGNNYDPGTGANYFNPYALISDDVIRVVLQVEDVTPGTKITDEVLQQPGIGGKWYCNPELYAGTSQTLEASREMNLRGTVSGLAPALSVEWIATGSVPKEYFQYTCKITQ